MTISKSDFIQHLEKSKARVEKKERERETKRLFYQKFVGPKKPITFLEHIEKCAAEVATWPAWKKECAY